MYRPGRSDAQIDHVLVGPSGAYVIHYAAFDHVEASFEAAVSEPSESALVVGALLPARYRPRVRPVLCFREAEPVADLVGGVLVTSSDCARTHPSLLAGRILDVRGRRGVHLPRVPFGACPRRTVTTASMVGIGSDGR